MRTRTSGRNFAKFDQRGELTSKVINIYETKNILIYIQSLIQSEASDSQLATRKIADPPTSKLSDFTYCIDWL
jgi:hypothetical protein